MCISLRPAEFSNTKLYAGEARYNNMLVHVLAYQNKAKSNGPNAMVLPLPALGTLGQQNTIDTRGFPLFLDDIQEATRHRTRGLSKGYALNALGDDAQVFDVGSYTVVLSASPAGVADALKLVPEKKRPELNAEIVKSFGTNYPGWQIAVCCWDGNVEAEPLLWWYQPMFLNRLFAPALDSHTGKAPDLTAKVAVDHNISFGSTEDVHGSPVTYQDGNDISNEARLLLPTRVRGTRVRGELPNGDFWFQTKQFAVGKNVMAERLPPSTVFTGVVKSTEDQRIPLVGWY